MTHDVEKILTLTAPLRALAPFFTGRSLSASALFKAAGLPRPCGGDRRILSQKNDDEEDAVFSIQTAFGLAQRAALVARSGSPKAANLAAIYTILAFSEMEKARKFLDYPARAGRSDVEQRRDIYEAGEAGAAQAARLIGDLPLGGKSALRWAEGALEEAKERAKEVGRPPGDTYNETHAKLTQKLEIEKQKAWGIFMEKERILTSTPEVDELMREAVCRAASLAALNAESATVAHRAEWGEFIKHWDEKEREARWIHLGEQ